MTVDERQDVSQRGLWCDGVQGPVGGCWMVNSKEDIQTYRLSFFPPSFLDMCLWDCSCHRNTKKMKGISFVVLKAKLLHSKDIKSIFFFPRNTVPDNPQISKGLFHMQKSFSMIANKNIIYNLPGWTVYRYLYWSAFVIVALSIENRDILVGTKTEILWRVNIDLLFLRWT